MTASSIQRHTTWADALVAILVLGYLSMTRSFAHVGYAPIYVGEASLVAFLLARQGITVWPWLDAMFRPRFFSGVAWYIFLSIGYGLIQCIRGLAYGYGVTGALQTFVFHLYPLFLFVGIGVGVRHPDLLRRLIRVLAWWVGLYGTAYVLVLGQYATEEDILTSTVSWFGQPHGAGVCLLGLIAFEKDLRRLWLPMLLDLFVLLGMQMRAAWVSLGAALVVWACLTGRLRKLLILSACVAGLLGIAAVLDLHYPAPAARGGQISARHILGRAIAVVDERTAESVTGNVADARTYHGNVSWRTDWWGAIWKMVHKSPLQALMGPGLGFPIWELHPSDTLRDPVRTPHNSYFFALGYTGWIGLALFCALQAALAGMLWNVYRRTGQAFGICLWAMAVTWACFDGFFETPYSAIPFYLLAGLATAAALTGPRRTGLRLASLSAAFEPPGSPR